MNHHFRIFSMLVLVVVCSLQASYAQSTYLFTYGVFDIESTQIRFVDPRASTSIAETFILTAPQGYYPPTGSIGVNKDREWTLFFLPSETQRSRLLFRVYNFATGETRDIFLGDIYGRPETSVRWSPNGIMIAFTAFQNEDSQAALYVYNLATDGLSRLSTDENYQRGAYWSNDSTRVATINHCANCADQPAELQMFNVETGVIAASINLIIGMPGNGNEVCDVVFAPNDLAAAFSSNCRFNTGLFELTSEVFVWDIQVESLRQVTRSTPDPYTDISQLVIADYELNWLSNNQLVIGVDYRSRAGVDGIIARYDLASERLNIASESGLSLWTVNPYLDEALLHTSTRYIEEANSLRDQRSGIGYTVSLTRITDSDFGDEVRSSASDFNVIRGVEPIWHPAENILAYTYPQADPRSEIPEILVFLNITARTTVEHPIFVGGNVGNRPVFSIGWIER